MGSAVNFSEIDAARERAGIRRYALAKTAGVSYSHYWALRKRKHHPQPSTLRRLEAALGELTGGPIAVKALAGEASRADLVAGVYRGYLGQIAGLLGLDVEAALANPRRREFWKARALALACANGAFNFPRSELARALGISKQLAHWNVRKAEELRETDPEVRRIAAQIDRLAPLVAGGGGW